MTAEVRIYSNLRYLGYVQDSAAGKNGQYLRYFNGRATWNTVADDGVNRIVTVPSSQDSLIDNDGNVISFGLDETYHGVETKPPSVVATRTGGDVIFLRTQAEYDAQDWQEGDIFIPTNDGITAAGTTIGIPITVSITFAPLNGDPDFDRFFNSLIEFLTCFALNGTRLFSYDGRNGADFDHPTAGDFEFRVQSSTPGDYPETVIERQGNTRVIVFTQDSLVKPEEIVLSFVEVLNSVSTDINEPTNITTPTGTLETGISRNFVSIANGDVLTLIFLNFDNTTEPVFNRSSNLAPATGSTSPAIIAPAEDPVVTTLNFVKNQMYVRRSGNNGWLVYTLATDEIIVAT